MPNETRSIFSSISTFRSQEAVWQEMTVVKATKEGYKASGWVYRAVSLIAKSIGQVPWVIRRLEDSKLEPSHPLQSMLLKPHPHFSKQDTFELIAMWLELTGNAYFKKVGTDSGTKELWPVSPDKIRPVASKDAGELIRGYEVATGGNGFKFSADYTADNMVHFKLLDPANPLIGIGPLSAAAKAVDLDTEQQDWNKNLMQNRGVPEGVFTFKEPLTEPQHKTIVEKIKEKLLGSKNARTPLVIGGDADYKRMSITPAEVDFLESRKFNREEIFSIFGIPPQLAGAMDASTYNNFSTALRIFWEVTAIPLLRDIKDTFNNTLATELDGRYIIDFDLSNVEALRESESELLDSAKKLIEMGVPMSQVSNKYSLGIEEYNGWDRSFTKTQSVPPVEQPQARKVEGRSIMLIPTEQRNIVSEQAKRDALAEGVVMTQFRDFFEKQKGAVFSALDVGNNPLDEIALNDDELLSVLTNSYNVVASAFVGTVAVDARAQPFDLERRDETSDAIEKAIAEALEEDAIILADAANINSTTLNALSEQFADAATQQKTVEQIKQAILDSGTFEPARALRIARTTAGTAASVGQLASATVAGANKKTWEVSQSEVRDAHTNRQGETVGIDERFSRQQFAIGPRYPVDPQGDVADRVNCRCSMTFSV